MLIHEQVQTGYLREDITALYPKLKKYCLSVTRNPWDAEDLAHDTIDKTLRFCLKNHSQQRQASLPLMMTIARNHWIDQIRKKSRESSEPMVEPASPDHPLDMLMSGLDTLMEHLTPKQLLVFVMKDIFTYRLSEISEMLDMNEMTVKSLLHRARRNISDSSAEVPVLEQYWKDIDTDWFQRYLLQSIRMEKPELLKELIDTLQQVQTQVPVSTSTHSRMSSVPSMSLRFAA